MILKKDLSPLKILYKKEKKEKEDYLIALAGNPNVGKSTLFNSLTGLNQHTGNWPGKTVERAEGYFFLKDLKIKIIDLPGTYSLLSNSEEEEIARDYLCFKEPDLVIVVADATSLERNLNLYLQISEISKKTLLCINLIDEAEKRHIEINKERLSELLKVPVLPSSAREKQGIEKLKESLYVLLKEDKREEEPKIKYDTQIEKALEKILPLLEDKKNIPREKRRWIGLRLLEGNEKILSPLIKNYNLEEKLLKEVEKIKSPLNKTYGEEYLKDAFIKALIKRGEYLKEEVLKKEGERVKFQRRLDNLLVSKTFGIPLMILTLLVILFITISLANYPSDLLSKLFSKGEILLREGLISLGLPEFLRGLLVDGIYVTLGWVVSVMLPPMAIFFPLFTLLEDLGYLPRIAFNLDKGFKKCLTCGKQALTMCMGLGCNAAGVIGCRIINSPRERIIAIITNVFMPCNGRFPMLISISTIFIGGLSVGLKGSFLSALSVTLIIILGVIMTFFVSRVLSLTLLKGVPSSFILELPPYRTPKVFRLLVRSILDRTLYVLGRALAVAAPAGAIIWLFSNISLNDTSLLTLCANYLNPFAEAIGLDGYILMAFILGLPANEIVMPIIIMSYLKSKTMIDIENLYELKNLLVSNGWTLLTAINVMLLSLMHYPCGTTLLTIQRETKSLKWTALSFLVPTLLGIFFCFLSTTLFKILNLA